VIENISDFRALDPFFRIIEQGLAGLVDGEHFFDLLAEDVVFDFIITLPEYPRHVVGRADLIELFRGYGAMFFLSRCYDLRVHHSPSTSTVVLEYSSQGKAVATGWPYSNRYISVVVIKDRKVAAWRDYLDPLRSSRPSRDALSRPTHPTRHSLTSAGATMDNTDQPGTGCPSLKFGTNQAGRPIEWVKSGSSQGIQIHFPRAIDGSPPPQTAHWRSWIVRMPATAPGKTPSPTCTPGANPGGVAWQGRTAE
jgi:uncharacterized protein